MKGTAVYVRVSSKSQDAASQTPELERHLKSVEGEVRWYRDKFTGRTMDRPGFNKLMADVRSGLVGRVVVWKLDRFGRYTLGVLELIRELKLYGASLYSVTEGLDTAADSPMQRAMLSMMATFAQLETEVRSERQLAGIAVAKAKGVKFGRPKGSGKGKRLVVAPEQEQLARRLKAEGSSVTGIARATGLTRPTIYAILKG